MPAISALMPVYNCRRFVAAAVRSVLAQTFTDFELVIVDDGSTDGSLEILQRLAAEDRRIRLFHRANRGLVESRNELVHRAAADLLAWCDSDDRYEPQRFALQYERFAREPELVCLGTGWQMIDTEDLPIKTFHFPNDHEAIRQMMLEIDNAIWFPTEMMRREPVLRLGGFRHPFIISEDYDLNLRLSECGRVANLPEVLCYYRQHLTSTVASRHWQAPTYSRLARTLAHERIGLGTDRLQRGEPVQLDFKPPLTGRASRVCLHLRWGWWALMEGYVGTARKHAVLSARHAPLSKETWRLIYCALRGH